MIKIHLFYYQDKEVTATAKKILLKFEIQRIFIFGLLLETEHFCSAFFLR